MEKQSFRSGFITIVGRTNVGKSTLMNALVGEKVAIVSPRHQTTRNRIMGVINRPGAQIVLLDTPGVHKPRTQLGHSMMRAVNNALEGVDGVLFVVDAGDVDASDRELVDRLSDVSVKKALAVNKVDSVTHEQLAPLLLRLNEWPLETFLPISAKTGKGLDALVDTIVSWLPEGPQYFPEDMITDQPERFFVAEAIREKALIHLREEVPHGIGVEIMEIKTHDGLCNIHATIMCEKASHKGIIIGKQGSMLKTIGTFARQDIERILGTRVNLELWVKVREGWRDSPATLRDLGYDDRE